ncbi:MAG: glycosyltransferase family 2 protein [Candidatus Omnitrophica bacterium]|nr:glycosyltransferase family 2 protein [Candidatus Omnitrophota bacterium]
MTSLPKVLVVIPCYNEEKRLPKTLFLDFASRESDYRFLFVDDGSRDHTLQLLESLRKERPDRFDVLKLEQNSGKAEAVRQGFLKGIQEGVPFIAFWDADLATPLGVLPSFLITLQARPAIEMVFGSRIKLMGHDIERREIRHYLGRIFATAVSFILKLNIYDTQCGAKMFRATETLRAMFGEKFHSKWIFDVELIARFTKVKKNIAPFNPGSSIYEMPLPVWHDIAGSKLCTLDFLKALIELGQIYFLYR